MGGDGAPRRLGLFGGTFDPPHVGHLIAAQDVVEALGLNTLHFVPARLPPHKRDQSFSPARLRLAMVEAALEDAPGLEASELEIGRDGPSFTVDTLRTLRERHPDDELFFVVGVDQFGELHAWKEPREVARLARLVVITREGDDPESVDPGVEVSYDFVPVTRVDVSSTGVRERVRQGRPIRYLVPEPVRRIIRRHGLYSEA